MANKKSENELTYLQMPLPTEAKRKTTVRINWSGLNKVQTMDTGELSLEENISTQDAPYLTPSPKRNAVFTVKGTPIGLWGFDDFLLLIYQDGDVKAKRLLYDANGDTDESEEAVSLTAAISGKNADTRKDALNSDTQRCAVMMNKYEGGAIDGKYTKHILIFPDAVSLTVKKNAKGTNAKGKYEKLNPADFHGGVLVPYIRYATVHLSRIYGVAGSELCGEPDRICVSGFNDYTNWNVDTDTDFSPSNAWVSAAQSNVKADGYFTGITTYLNSVVAFKRDYMHEITGSSNPFRINDIYAEGATNNDNIVDVDGNLFFTSDDAVKVYTGGNPRVMSYKLGKSRFENAVAGTDGRRYYLYCGADGADGAENHRLFVYDTVVMQWAEEKIDTQVLNFAKTDYGFYMLTKTGKIYQIDTNDYQGQEWAAETDLTAGQTVDIKHIQKIQILADIEKGSELRAYLIYDNEKFDENKSHLVYDSGIAEKTKKAAIRVVPRMTAHYGAKLRLCGTGYSRIYQAEITLKGGGEIYKPTDE